MLLRQLRAHRDRLHVRDTEAATERIVLAAMELQQSRAHLADDLANLVGRVVHEQRDRVHQRGERVAHRARLFGFYLPRATLGEHETDRIHAQFARQADIPGAGKAAELDAGAKQRPAHKLTSSGSPHCAG